MRIAKHVAFAIAAACTACGNASESNPADYPRDGVLRLNQLQAKGTHNSYHVAPDGTAVSAWRYTELPLDRQLAEQGVRALELDTNYDDASGTFLVYHLIGFDDQTTCHAFVECLSVIEAWSSAHPQHHTLFIQIEPKSLVPTTNVEDYFAEFEGEITRVFERDRILTPDDVRGDAATLRDAVTGKGWPTLGATRGKVLFFLDNTTDFRAAYTRGGTSLEGRLLFVNGDPTDPLSGVLILNDPGPDVEQAVRDGFIVRTRADSDNVEPLAGDTTRRDAALASGAQIVSTDYPAPVEGIDYFVEIPGGTPSRCNPISALACTSKDIENPSHLK